VCAGASKPHAPCCRRLIPEGGEEEVPVCGGQQAARAVLPPPDTGGGRAGGGLRMSGVPSGRMQRDRVALGGEGGVSRQHDAHLWSIIGVYSSIASV
jgi:hypothetical protein